MMSPDSDIDWERLDRYISGEGTPEQRAALRDWVDANPELQVATEVMRTAHRLPGERAVGWDLAGSWAAVTHRLGFEEPVAAEPHPRGRLLRLTPADRGGPWRRRTRAALAAAAIATGIVVTERSWELVRGSRSSTDADDGSREYVASRGQRLVIHLPDRTHIALAPETRLRVARDYGRQDRTVELAGQAYFSVTHDSTRPFRVRAGNLLAEDLGTEFLVRAYAGEPPDVVVREGVVAVGQARVVAGQRARISESGTAILESADVATTFAWTDGQLAFRRTPLRDAIADLRRWYDIDVVLADPSIGDEQVTASFRDESGRKALDLMAAALGLVVEQRGDRFMLHRK